MTSTKLVLYIFSAARSLWELETLCYSKLKLRTWHAIVVLFLVSYPGWNVGGLKLVCTKDMSEQEKDGWKKRQVSYDPKDKAILDPIFAGATATDNPDQNPSQNFNGLDYFEASVRDVPLQYYVPSTCFLGPVRTPG
jgi:hypothetical protein